MELVDPVFRQYENGPEQSTGHEYRGGDVIWFDCRVQRYGRTEDTDPRFALSWTGGVMDRLRRSVTPAKQGTASGELTGEDKDYRPRIRFEFQLPPLLPPGDYVVGVALEDEIAKTKASKDFTFHVGGRAVEIAAELTAAQFLYFAKEEDRRPLDRAVYRPGQSVWLRFDILGFQHGPKNKIDVEYGLLVLGPSGQPFLRQDPAAAHAAETFYPQFYVPAALEIRLPPKATAGQYIALVTVRDKVSGKTAAAHAGFTVE